MTDTVHNAPKNLPPRHLVEIRRVEWKTPRLANLLLHGPGLSDFQPGDPGAHIKLILPSPGMTDTPQPLRYDGFRPVFAEGVVPPFLRTYTPLRYNAEDLELEVEMLYHGDSPASEWLRRVRIGHRIVVAGPRGGWEPRLDGDWYLIMADETGIPAAVQVLNALPDQPCTTIFEVENERERRSLPGVPDDSPVWWYRDQLDMSPGEGLEQAVRKAEFPQGRGYIWVALEAGAMRRIRRYLLVEKGLLPEQMVTRGYWKLGAPDHPDGDYGE